MEPKAPQNIKRADLNTAGEEPALRMVRRPLLGREATGRRTPGVLFHPHALPHAHCRGKHSKAETALQNILMKASNIEITKTFFY